MADCEGSKDSVTKTEVPIIMQVYSPGGTTTNNIGSDDEENKSNDKTSERSTDSQPPMSEEYEKNSSENNDKGPSIAPSQFPFFKMNRSQAMSGACKLKPSLLRPSQLGAVTSPQKSVILEPAKFQNPFAKNENNTTSENEVSGVENNVSKNAKTLDGDDVQPRFLTFGSGFNNKESDNQPTISGFPSSSSTSSFVFGQNLKERVATKLSGEGSDSTTENEEHKEEVAANNENGSSTSELLFSNAAAICKSTAKTNLTLSEAAQEIEEANRSNKRKYSEVALLTGEEDETNVLQINCKLFAFDKATGTWQERGRGSLRLNDKDEESRLVARAAGTQRLVLNTMIWPGMTAERAGLKSLRLTAMDVQGDIKVFVVQAAPKEVDQLHNLLMQRLKRAQARQSKKVASEQ